MEENKKKLTWGDVLNRTVFLRAVPLAGISGKSLCDIIMMQVHYGKANDAFNERVNEGLKKLKEEKYPKFDEEAQKNEEERSEEFAKWNEELTKLFADMRNEEISKEVEGVQIPKMTREILAAVCETGVDGEIRLFDGQDGNPVMVPKVELLRLLGSMIED